MENNMGKTDKTIRISVAVIIGILYFSGIISGMVASMLGVLAIVFILTSFISFCPLYLPFKINTNKKQ